MTFLDVFADDENDAQYHNPAYNALIAKAKASNDERQRMAYLHEAEQLLFDDCVIIPLYYTTQPYVAQPYIKGYRHHCRRRPVFDPGRRRCDQGPRLSALSRL